MADRSYIYCPFCEKNNVKEELLTGAPETHLFRCQFGHVFERQRLMDMNPTLIKYDHHEKPGPHDVKATVWVNGQLYQKFCEKFPERVSATMASIMALALDDNLIIVSGDQAKKLKELSVRTGAEMVSCAQVKRQLEAQNEELSKENNRFWDALRSNAAV
jgi:hypothetical protein